jgi:hypothetical protein
MNAARRIPAALIAQTAGYMREARADAAADLNAAKARLAAATTDEARIYAEETVRICRSAVHAMSR